MSKPDSDGKLTESTDFLKPFYKRFILASLIWFLVWPILYFFKLGEITGHKA